MRLAHELPLHENNINLEMSQESHISESEIFCVFAATTMMIATKDLIAFCTRTACSLSPL
jgi:hypothetical protein